MIDTMDDVRMGREQSIGFDFFESEGDGFLAEWTTDLLQSVELGRGRFLGEVDIRKAALDMK